MAFHRFEDVLKARQSVMALVECKEHSLLDSGSQGNVYVLSPRWVIKYLRVDGIADDAPLRPTNAGATVSDAPSASCIVWLVARELQTMHDLRIGCAPELHPRISRELAARAACVVMERATCSVHDVTRASDPLTPAAIDFIACSLIDAMINAHRARWRHMDLHPRQVLLRLTDNDNNVSVTVGDWGSAVRSERVGGGFGCWDTLPPEAHDCIQNDSPSSVSSTDCDTWAVAYILLSLVLNVVGPFGTCDEDDDDPAAIRAVHRRILDCPRNGPVHTAADIAGLAAPPRANLETAAAHAVTDILRRSGRATLQEARAYFPAQPVLPSDDPLFTVLRNMKQ